MQQPTDRITINGKHCCPVSTDALSFYKNYWKKGDQASPESRQRFNQIMDRYFPEGIKDKRILELGVGGQGGLIYHLKNENDVFGVDASSTAKDNCLRMGLPIQIQNLDREPLQFEDASMDIVFAMEVFEHFSAPQFVLEGIRRILKPNGLCIISTPHPLTHHWPRLFYPNLFQQNAFKEFLMINEFEVTAFTGIGEHGYSSFFTDQVDRCWSLLWKCRKLKADDIDVFFKNGLYFWNKKDKNDIRLSPMEAIDCFRRCYELDPSCIEPRILLTRSLFYRFINGELQEFNTHLKFLSQLMQDTDNLGRLFALYHFAMIFMDLLQIDPTDICQNDIEKVLSILANSGDEGRLYYEKIMEIWKKRRDNVAI